MFEQGYIARRDILIIALLLILSFGSFGYWGLTQNAGAARVKIEVAGSLLGEYDLNEEQTIDIPGADGQVMNQVIITGGAAYMSEADCPDKICVKQGKISRLGQSIVCLPNRVVVSVSAGQRTELDSVVK